MDEMVQQPWHRSLCDPMTLEQRCYPHCVLKSVQEWTSDRHQSHFCLLFWVAAVHLDVLYIQLVSCWSFQLCAAKVLQNYEFKRRELRGKSICNKDATARRFGKVLNLNSHFVQPKYETKLKEEPVFNGREIAHYSQRYEHLFQLWSLNVSVVDIVITSNVKVADVQLTGWLACSWWIRLKDGASGSKDQEIQIHIRRIQGCRRSQVDSHKNG